VDAISRQVESRWAEQSRARQSPTERSRIMIHEMKLKNNGRSNFGRQIPAKEVAGLLLDWFTGLESRCLRQTGAVALVLCGHNRIHSLTYDVHLSAVVVKFFWIAARLGLCCYLKGKPVEGGSIIQTPLSEKLELQIERETGARVRARVRARGGTSCRFSTTDLLSMLLYSPLHNWATRATCCGQQNDLPVSRSWLAKLSQALLPPSWLARDLQAISSNGFNVARKSGLRILLSQLNCWQVSICQSKATYFELAVGE